MRDPSLRLKNSFARDDVGKCGKESAQNSTGTTTEVKAE
jgi:hypothetical protein